MSRLFILLHTLVSRLLLIVVCLLFFPVVVCIALLSPQVRFSNKIVFFFVNLFYKLVLRCVLVPISYKNNNSTVFAKPAIIIANHQSSLDIPLVGLLLGRTGHFWLARHELMDSFVLRYTLPIFAQVVNVLSPRLAAVSLRKVVRTAMQTGAHVVLFPEGSRSLDGALQPFFDGYVWLAKQLKRAVIPVYIHDAYKVYPRNSFLIKKVPITVTVGEPLLYNEADKGASLKASVEQWFASQNRQG